MGHLSKSRYMIYKDRMDSHRSTVVCSNQAPDSGQVVLLPERETVLQRPRRYQVVVLNDDYTPMEFVVDVLAQFFGLNLEQATRVMLQVHHEGRAGVGNFTRDVAETKATLVVDHARQHGHPLLCQAEPIP